MKEKNLIYKQYTRAEIVELIATEVDNGICEDGSDVALKILQALEKAWVLMLAEEGNAAWLFADNIEIDIHKSPITGFKIPIYLCKQEPDHD